MRSGKVSRLVRKILPTNSFARGVSVLVGGTAGAQMILVLAAPLLTRLYSPEDFGVLAVYVGLLAIAAVVSSMRYELAIPLPQDGRDAARLLVLSLGITGLTTLVTAMLVAMFGKAIASALGVPLLADIFWLLPLGVLFQGTYKALNYWAIRTKKFPLIAKTRIRQSVGTLAIQLCGFKLGVGALVAGQAGGQGVGIWALGRSAFRDPSFRDRGILNVLTVAKRYKYLPLYSTWSGLFNVAGKQLPPLMFAALFSASAAGLYALAHRVLALPISLVGEAIGKVFFSNAAEAYREQRLGNLVCSVHDKLAQIAMPPAVMLMIVSPEAFELAFGRGWREAGDFARWMTPWIYMVFITSPLSTLFSVMEKEQHGLIFQIGLLAVRVVAIAVGAWYGQLIVAVILYSLSSAICWGGFLIWIARITGNKFNMILQPALRALLVSGMISAPLWVARLLEVTAAGWVLAGAVCLALIAGHYYLMFRKAYV